MKSPGLMFRRIVLVLSVGMCEVEGITGGDGTAGTARFGTGGKRWSVPVVLVGGTVGDKMRGGDERDARESSPSPAERR